MHVRSLPDDASSGNQRETYFRSSSKSDPLVARILIKEWQNVRRQKVVHNLLYMFLWSLRQFGLRSILHQPVIWDSLE